jgi:hypothetical protein
MSFLANGREKEVVRALFTVSTLRVGLTSNKRVSRHVTYVALRNFRVITTGIIHILIWVITEKIQKFNDFYQLHPRDLQ